MPILFRCDHCRQKLSIPSRKAGKTLKCPKCAREIVIPIPEAKLADEEPVVSGKESELAPTREMPASEREKLEEDDKGWEPTRELAEKNLANQETAPIPISAGPVLGGMAEPPRFPPQTAARPEGEEEEFELRRARTELEEMDLTPMVDVTFLLLIFFMITASFSLTKTIETPAPDPDKQGAQTLQNLEELEKTSITVRIDEQDNITIQDHDKYDTTPIDPGDLELVLGDMLRTEQKNELIIQASAQCRHEAFVNVFDAGTGSGMQKIRLAASKSEE